MAGKAWFIIGAAVGYVVGTRTGRQGYEKIKRQAADVWHSAPVQKGVDTARAYVREIPVVGEKISDAFGATRTKVDDAAHAVPAAKPTAND
jgi:hypothetical protein